MRLFAKYSLLWAELFVILLGLTAVAMAKRSPLHAWDSLRARCARIASKPRFAVACSFTFPIVLRLLAWPFLLVPTPSVHDEFSYLLMADTFASGRLTNPTHPLWIHFETFHVLQHPTYASIYPVMQGFFLAAGQVLAHQPWLGVWLSAALMCAAICWALQAWLPPFWALAGAALAAVRLGIFSYWMNSYWGGSLGALGGALVLGAVPRVLRRRKTGDAIILGIGIAVLANSRPYEGFALCVPVAIVFVAWSFGAKKFCHWCGLQLTRRPAPVHVTARLIAPLAVVLILTAIFMSYYFWRVTGDPLTMPYVAEAQQYSITPLFVWQKLRPEPAYNDERLRYFYSESSPKRIPQRKRAFAYWAFYLGPVLTIPLLMLPRIFRDRRTRFLLLVSGAMLPALAVEWWAHPHYAAPLTAALYGLVLQGLRHLRCGFRHSRWRHLALLVPATVLAMVVTRIVLPYAHMPVTPESPQTWASVSPPFNMRHVVERLLTELGGKHLVLVRYSDHNREPAIHDEWIYNAADIDQSPVVWARELDGKRNQELLDYFRGRRVWVADPDLRKLMPLN